jgi:hypothetical protein
MKMKCAVVAILISPVFVSQAFAVLRPLFPVKPGAPFNGDVIIIGDGLVPDSAKKTPAASPESGTAASAWTERYRLVTNAGPSVGYVSAKISTRAKSGME